MAQSRAAMVARVDRTCSTRTAERAALGRARVDGLLLDSQGRSGRSELLRDVACARGPGLLGQRSAADVPRVVVALRLDLVDAIALGDDYRRRDSWESRPRNSSLKVPQNEWSQNPVPATGVSVRVRPRLRPSSPAVRGTRLHRRAAHCLTGRSTPSRESPRLRLVGEETLHRFGLSFEGNGTTRASSPRTMRLQAHRSRRVAGEGLARLPLSAAARSARVGRSVA